MLLLQDLDAFWGSSGFSVNIYVNGQLSQQYSGDYACFTLNSIDLGYCPEGGSGEVVLTCQNYWDDCPLYIWWAGGQGTVCRR